MGHATPQGNPKGFPARSYEADPRLGSADVASEFVGFASASPDSTFARQTGTQRWPGVASAPWLALLAIGAEEREVGKPTLDGDQCCVAIERETGRLEAQSR